MWGLQATKPDLANFAKDKEKLRQAAMNRKEQTRPSSGCPTFVLTRKVSVNKAIEQPSDEAPVAAGPIED